MHKNNTFYLNVMVMRW